MKRERKERTNAFDEEDDVFLGENGLVQGLDGLAEKLDRRQIGHELLKVLLSARIKETDAKASNFLLFFLLL